MLDFHHRRRCCFSIPLSSSTILLLLYSWFFLSSAPFFIVIKETTGFTIHSQSRPKTKMNAVASTTARRAVGKLKADNTMFLLCDIQERFMKDGLIWRGDTVVRTAQYMTSVAKALSIPIVVTQQYTKVFGPTVPDVFSDPENDLKTFKVFEKKKFSMCTDDCQQYMDALGKTSVVLFGIEAHVCVQQTALDMLEQGKEVHIVVDGVSSQQPYDREIALQRMSQAGAYLTTAQSAAFMLMKSADHENFKTVSKLTVDHMKLPNEFNDALK